MSEMIPPRPDVQAVSGMPAPPPAVTFGQWLKAQRVAAGLSQERLARELDCSRGTIQNVETGRSTPHHAIFVRACDFFGVALPYQL